LGQNQQTLQKVLWMNTHNELPFNPGVNVIKKANPAPQNMDIHVYGFLQSTCHELPEHEWSKGILDSCFTNKQIP
jgi:hypothetical protein